MPCFLAARLRRLFVVAIGVAIAGLSACTTSPSSKLAESVAPIQGVWVVASLGSYAVPIMGPRGPGSPASRFMQARLPEVLRKNGVAVSGYQELPRPLAQIDELERLWARHTELHATTSHVLVLTSQRVKTVGQAISLEYEAVLWDARAHQLVWKGAPSTFPGAGAQVEADRLTGDVLRLLQRDKLIALPLGYPVDPDDKEIPRQWHALTLY